MLRPSVAGLLPPGLDNCPQSAWHEHQDGVVPGGAQSADQATTPLRAVNRWWVVGKMELQRRGDVWYHPIVLTILAASGCFWPQMRALKTRPSMPHPSGRPRRREPAGSGKRLKRGCLKSCQSEGRSPDRGSGDVQGQLPSGDMFMKQVWWWLAGGSVARWFSTLVYPTSRFTRRPGGSRNSPDRKPAPTLN